MMTYELLVLRDFSTHFSTRSSLKSRAPRTGYRPSSQTRTKTLHILRLADDEPYRREGKRQANLTEGRHDLARNVYHGRKGEVHQAYYDGMEDQLSALGLVLNCVVLWNTVYLDHAVTALRTQGYPVLDEDVARLSAFIRAHLGLDGHYSFVLPDLEGRPRPLRDPDCCDDE